MIWRPLGRLRSLKSPILVPIVFSKLFEMKLHIYFFATDTVYAAMMSTPWGIIVQTLCRPVDQQVSPSRLFAQLACHPTVCRPVGLSPSCLATLVRNANWLFVQRNVPFCTNIRVRTRNYTRGWSVTSPLSKITCQFSFLGIWRQFFCFIFCFLTLTKLTLVRTDYCTIG